MKTVAIVGTFDSKAEEFLYAKKLFEKLGLHTLTIHCGIFEPGFVPDISNNEVAAAAGENIAELAAQKDRAKGTQAMARGLAALAPQLYRAGKFQGILSFGGSGGTAIATPAMRALPVGVPKLMVSTVASGDTRPYMGESDVIMMPSIVDVSGLNSISLQIFSNAVKAMAGMLKYEAELPEGDKPLIAATMFGVTTPCIETARKIMEEAGYEVLVFHATGTGGRTMEHLIDAGYFAGVLDLTTTEFCDELMGGIFPAGPHRLEAAGRKGVPQVVSVGALDMVNFGPYDQVPQKYSARNLYRHNPTITLMRTTAEENQRMGRLIAQKLNAAKGPTSLLFPLGGVSSIDREGQPFYGPRENAALFEALRNNIDPAAVELVEISGNINDKAFARAAAEKLLAYLQA